MPVFQNVSLSDLYLPREDGLKPDIRLLPDRQFSGSLSFYYKYTLPTDMPPLLARVAVGWPEPSVITTGPDALTVLVDGFFNDQGVVATTADVAAFGAVIVAGTAYLAYGVITWYEGTTQYTEKFSCNTSSVFTFSAVTPAGSTSSAASGVITLREGKIVFALNGANAINPVVQVVYEPAQQGWRGPTYRNPLLDSSLFTTKQTVNASNQVTKIVLFYTGSKVGDPKKVTTMTYTGVQVAPDTIVEEIGLVTDADLNF
jgi:hypothetical protein